MRIIIGDTETAGFMKPTPEVSGVVQAAYIEIEKGSEGKYVEVAAVNHLIDPCCPISPGASEIHGIYDHHVAGKPKLHEALKLEGPMFFIAHNRAFDLPRYAPHIENLVGSLCTLMAARRHCKDAPDNKLGTLVEHYGLEKHQAHDALGDVRMTLGLLNKLLEITGLDLLELAKNVNTPKVPTEMPFGKYKGMAFSALPSNYILYLLGLENLEEGLKIKLDMERRTRGNGI